MIADVMRPERADFEAWARDHGFSVETEEGDYVDRATRLAASAYRHGMKAGLKRSARPDPLLARVPYKLEPPPVYDAHYAATQTDSGE